MRTRRHHGQRGFTLIEVLAVVAILALVATLVVPNLGGLRMRKLRNEARSIAALLELARQRAIVTGVPHRLWMELDQAEYRLEWLSEDPEVAASASPVADLDLSGNTPLSLAAPRAEDIRFRPMPGNFGNTRVVEYPFYFEGVETPEGFIEDGQVSVEFARDGTSSYSEIYLQDSSGNRIALDVHPLDERVRIRDEF